MELNEVTIWRYFKGKGLNDFGVAGLMGNLFAESLLNPRNLQNSYEHSLGMNDNAYVAAVDNGTYTNFVTDKAGFGLAQWTHWTRKDSFLSFVKARGASIGDLNTQLDFLWKELSEGYRGVLSVLQSATSVLEASNAVLLDFERPANQSIGVQRKRAEYGQRYYNELAGGSQKGESKMKYTTANPPMQCFMRQSPWYKGSGKTTVKGVLWHSTGANNPTLKRYVQPDDNAPDTEKMLEVLGKNAYGNDWNHVWNHQPLRVGVHAFIGKLANGKVTTVQAGDWDKVAWGCGSGRYGSCNNGWIQFEICEDELRDPVYFEKVYREAVELTAYLCKLYNLDPHGTVTYNGVKVPVILCHQDSYRLGLGSGHADVMHWFPKFGKSMETVRNDVAALMGIATNEEDDDMDVNRFKELWGEMRKELQDNDQGAWSKEGCNWCIANGIITGGDKLPDGSPNYMFHDVLTREQMCVMLYRFAKLMGKS